MKLLFAGPSLSGLRPDLGDVALRPPAAHGDLARAVLDGAAAIGLVDGYFDAVAAVWHKEILFALRRGVVVLGGGSMGALRAAECAAFGMQPVGRIAASYCDGSRDDDADVGLIHGPAELDYLPLSEPMVDVEATLAHLLALGVASSQEVSRITAHARAMHFSERSLDRLVPPDLAPRRPTLLDAYRTHRVAQKARDALEVLTKLRELPDERGPPAPFTMAESPMWRRRLQALGG